MATYKIAPDSTGEIGMAQMKYGLVNKADYNNSNGVTTEINMETLVVNSTTYQGDLSSKTWNTSTPYGFGEMYGQTWNDTPDTLTATRTSFFATGTYTTVTNYGSETDPGNNFNPTTGIYTAPSTGNYTMNAQLQLDYSTGFTSRSTGIRITKNGTSTIVTSQTYTVPSFTTGTNNVICSISNYSMTAGDTLRVVVLNDLQAAEGGTNSDVVFNITATP